jgi:CHASE2 domain-containing sensor protein
MAGTELKLSWRTFILGLLLTCLAAAADYAGYFTSIERWFYDRRARDCQFYPHEPTDRLIHLDIDDDAIENVGAWPWKRRVMAQVLDELHLAGPKAIALDVFFFRAAGPAFRARPRRAEPRG